MQQSEASASALFFVKRGSGILVLPKMGGEAVRKGRRKGAGSLRRERGRTAGSGSGAEVALDGRAQK